MMNKIFFKKKMKNSKILCIGSTSLTEGIRHMLHNEYHIDLENSTCIKDYCEKPGEGVPDNTKEAMSISDVVTGKGFNTIIVDDRLDNMQIFKKQLLHLSFSGIPVFDAPHFYEHITGKTPVTSIDDSWLLFHNQGARSHSLICKVLKNISDKFIAFSGIMISAPLMLLCALAIRLSSQGPVFFRQERLGRNEKPFVLIKFRTMINNAEKETGPKWAGEDDPRITAVGKFLRKTRLDELPQLFNVIKGNMSVVGPRPIRKHFADILAQEIPYYRLRFAVKPGITGWAQVCGDYAGSHEGQREKLEFDLYYIRNQSLLFDLLIFFKTVKTVILQKGQ